MLVCFAIHFFGTIIDAVVCAQRLYAEYGGKGACTDIHSGVHIEETFFGTFSD